MHGGIAPFPGVYADIESERRSLTGIAPRRGAKPHIAAQPHGAEARGRYAVPGLVGAVRRMEFVRFAACGRDAGRRPALLSPGGCGAGERCAVRPLRGRVPIWRSAFPYGRPPSGLGGVRAAARLRPAVPIWRSAFPRLCAVGLESEARFRPLRGRVPTWRLAVPCLCAMRRGSEARFRPLRGRVPTWRSAFPYGRPPSGLGGVRAAARLRRAVPIWRSAFPCPCAVGLSGVPLPVRRGAERRLLACAAPPRGGNA